jgi:hypothetical protein
MDMARLTRVSSVVLVSLTLITACTRADPPAATTAPSPLQQAEAEAWATVLSSHPAVPIIVPTWLPPSIDRTKVEVRGIGYGPQGQSDPIYRVAYVAASGATILFALGPTPAAGAGDSAIGTRVRNSGAALIYVGGWPATSGAVVTRQVRWIEGNHVLRIESDRFTGEDLLHIAWSLDRTGAPAPKNPYTRAKPGTCAAQGAAPEETVRRLLALVGEGDRDAVRDCFSLELLGDYPGYGDWATLPRASDGKLSPPSAIAGRFVVGASWRFASDPGGAWGPQPHHFFTLGLEDGRWRVYETATAAIGPPP